MKRMMVGALVGAVVTVVLATGALAADEVAGTQFYWIGGGGDWSDVTKWFADADGKTPAERYPGQDGKILNDVANVTAAAAGTINVDKEVRLFRFFVNSKKTMTFEGNGKITTAAAVSSSANLRSSINSPVLFKTRYAGKYLDCRDAITFGEGAEITIAGMLYLWNAAKVYFEDGMVFSGGRLDLECQSGDAILTINGGTITATSVYLGRTHCHFRLFGGSVTAGLSAIDNLSDPSTCSVTIGGGSIDLGSNAFSLPEGLDWTFTNGTLRTSKNISDRRLLGSGNAVVYARQDAYSAVNVLNTDGSTLEFNTTLYATNGEYTSFGVTNDATIVGNGTMYLSRLYFGVGADREIHFGKDLKLCFRVGPTWDKDEKIYFTDGARFGSIGNWAFKWRTHLDRAYVGGDVDIDTQNAFDSAVKHAVTLTRLSAAANTAVSVSGGGSASLSFSAATSPFRRFSVAADTCLTLTMPALRRANGLDLASGSTLELASPQLMVDDDAMSIDPTARIVVNIPANQADGTYPLLNCYSPTGERDFSSQVVLQGEGSEGFAVKNVLGFAYLSNVGEPTYPQYGTSNIWTGAVSGSWKAGGNWVSGSAPATSDGAATLCFGGTRNTVVTNDFDVAEGYFNRIHFLDSCGPFVLRGKKFRIKANGYRNLTTTPLSSASRFPVIIENDFRMSNALSATTAADSYIALMGTVTVGGLYRPVGDIRIGGTLTAKGLWLESGSYSKGRPTRARILDGGKMVITASYTNQTKEASAVVIDKGGVAEFQNGSNAYLGYRVAQQDNVVDGLMDVQCPMGTRVNPRFTGSGRMNIASIESFNEVGWDGQMAEFQFGGGLTVQPTEWFTTDDVQPTSSTRLHAVGDVTLAVTNRCWYGPQPGVETATEAADRAMLIDAGATLTIAASDCALQLADPIAGAGTLAFADGAKLEPAGLLDNGTTWTELARVGVVEGLPDQTCYRFKTVENDDGTVSLMAKARGGSLIILR